MAMLNTVRFVVCCLLLLNAAIVPQITAQIDQTILNAGELNALEMFHVAEDGTVMVRSELDIMTPLFEFNKVKAASSSIRKKKNTVRILENKWPNALVRYEITSSIRDYSHGIREAMNSIKKLTCVRFEVNNTAIERVQIIGDQEGCWTHLAYRPNRTLQLNLAKECHDLSTVQHEILHTLGVVHEHSCYDRDKYIFLLKKATGNDQFMKANKVEFNDYDIEYNYRSIMHYSINFGAIPNDIRYLYVVGRYTYISIRDIKLVNLAYKCTGKLCCNKKKTCPFGGVVIPNDYNGEPKCQCWCSSGKRRNEDQLVLCSSLNKSMEPVYRLKSQSSLMEAEHETCKDLLTDCVSYKKKGLCFTELVKMRKMCTKTCNFCGKGQDLCMDHDETCAVMAEAGVCKDEGIEKLMSQLCPKSCGQCTGYYSACDLQRAMEEPEITTNSAAINGHWAFSIIVFYIHVLLV